MGLLTGRRTRPRGTGKDMARRPRGHEKIYMERKRFGYFPQQFTWRGRRYHVEAVEHCWTISRRHLGNRVERHCFRVRCMAVNGQSSFSSRAVLGGTFELYQDLKTSVWHMGRVVSRA